MVADAKTTDTRIAESKGMMVAKDLRNKLKEQSGLPQTRLFRTEGR